MNLKPTETELTGKWIAGSGGVAEDQTCQRIKWLLSNRLKKAATGASGWDELYLDPLDGRYWELTYPQSELHGGGPPRLTVSHADPKFFGLNPVTILVPLLDEGVPVWRPTPGQPYAQDVYRVLPLTTGIPKAEKWAFPAYTVVRCEFQVRSGERVLVATAKENP